MTKIKICGLFRETDIDYVNQAGPDYIGFIINYPASHRNIDPENAASLRAGLKPGIKTVGVFVDQPQEYICQAAKKICLDVIQLHGREDAAYIRSLKEKTSLPVWKAFKIRSKDDLANVLTSPADEVLLDAGSGSGRVFDWTLLKDFSRPFLLAGGLCAGNIGEAIRLLSPKLLDISSGAETDRVKDPAKIAAAVAAARKS